MKAEIKPGFGHDRVKLSDAIPLDTPFTLNIVPATVCNFKCNYCLHSLSKEKLADKNFIPGVMNWDVFLRTAEQAKAFPQPLKVISLTGNGEPLCNKRLPEMVAHLKDIKASGRVEFISNGALLNEDTSLQLIEAGLDTIRISIQGLSSEKYFDVCGVRQDFDEFLEKLSFFYKHKGNTKLFVKIIDVALEPGEEDKFYKIFGDISDRVFIEKVMPVFHGVDYSKMIKEEETVDRYGKAHKKRYVCPQSFFTLSVWPDGEVYPCDVVSDPAYLGNIKDTTLIDIWNGERRREFLRMQLMKKRMQNPVCRNCCAPDDVSQPEDELDSYAEELMKRF